VVVMPADLVCFCLPACRCIVGKTAVLVFKISFFAWDLPIEYRTNQERANYAYIKTCLKCCAIARNVENRIVGF
jgi:hypothetical protein